MSEEYISFHNTSDKNSKTHQIITIQKFFKKQKRPIQKFKHRGMAMFKATTDKLIMLKKIGFRMFNLHGNIYMVSVSAVRPDMTIFQRLLTFVFIPVILV